MAVLAALVTQGLLVPEVKLSNITVNGRMTHLGYYSDAWDAAESYNRAAIRAWGEFSYLNAQIGKEQQGMSEE